MRLAAALLAPLLVTCRRTPPPRAAAPGTTVSVASTAVEFGVGFPLTVTHVVRSGAPPPAEPSLAPLVTRLEATAAGSSDDGWIVEERRYRAWAFALGDLDLAGSRLHVRSALPPDDDGRPELPEDLLDVPTAAGRARLAWIVAAAVAMGAALAAFTARVRRRARAHPRIAAPGSARLSAGARARERLERLRRRSLDDRAALAAFHDEAAALLRDYVEERFEPRAPTRTSEELIGDAALARTLGAAASARLGTVLPALDRVRFGRDGAPPAAARALLVELATFVAETSP